jgi:SOS-response transcriptional repressor LexA
MSEIFSEGGGCSELEPFALRVTDDSMAPEFPEGCILVIEPALSAQDGSFVVADYGGDTWFRQFNEQDGKRYLTPLNERYAEMELIGPYQIRGIIIGQSYKGKRKKYPIY